jgi:rhomboid family GlyGly-CTERM serine protease
MRIRPTELFFWLLALTCLNLPLLAGRVEESALFIPSRVAAGEWWRVLTAPFVHVSAYHLLLDAGAFLLLYAGLSETSLPRKGLLVATCAAGSFTAALTVLKADDTLCGLSGIDHGLLAYAALDYLSDSDRRLSSAGVAGLAAVVAKSVYEALTGDVVFQSLHLGDIACPVAVCHAGGVLGGLIAFLVLHVRQQGQRKETLSGRSPNQSRYTPKPVSTVAAATVGHKFHYGDHTGSATKHKTGCSLLIFWCIHPLAKLRLCHLAAACF